MAQGRMLLRRISKNDQLAAVIQGLDASMGSPHGAYAALLFTWCIAHQDVEGRMHGDPRLVRADVFPLLEWITTAHVESYLRALHDAKLIVWYLANKRRYIAFPGFKDSQPGLRKEREPESIIPPPSQVADEMPAECRQPDGEMTGEVESEGKGREVNQAPVGAGPVQQDFKLRTQTPPAKAKKPKVPQADFAALLEAWQTAWVRIKRPVDGRPPTATDADRGQIAHILRRYPLKDAIRYLDRFMADTDSLVVKNSHHLAFMTARIDSYRETATKPGPVRPPLADDLEYGDDD